MDRVRGRDRFSGIEDMARERGRDRFSPTEGMARERGRDRFSPIEELAGERGRDRCSPFEEMARERGRVRFSPTEAIKRVRGRDRFSPTADMERERGRDRFSGADENVRVGILGKDKGWEKMEPEAELMSSISLFTITSELKYNIIKWHTRSANSFPKYLTPPPLLALKILLYIPGIRRKVDMARSRAEIKKFKKKSYQH